MIQEVSSTAFILVTSDLKVIPGGRTAGFFCSMKEVS